MKLILGTTIALLALVSVGLAVYAYTEHREVAYVTLRADALEKRIEAPPEPTAVAEPLPAASGSEPVVYTDQQILESRDQGPYRPECVTARSRSMQVPDWMRTSFLDSFGCATVSVLINNPGLLAEGD
jgi:hypothetical protein